MNSTNTPDGRLIAIGDIHGHSRALTAVLDCIEPRENDTLVTLGDAVNRGPDACGVLERLIRLRKCCKVVSLMGNHEELMLDARRDQYSRDRWRELGGWETLYSYSSSGSIKAIPQSHWQFLEGCYSHFETERFLFFHANYQWNLPPSKQPPSLLRWQTIEEQPPKAHFSGKKVFVGHSAGVHRDLGFCCCIDTGCGFGGCLTALDVRTGRIWQATESGERLPEIRIERNAAGTFPSLRG